MKKVKKYILVTLAVCGLFTAGLMTQSALSAHGDDADSLKKKAKHFIAGIVSIEKGIYGGELAVPVNKSQFLKVHRPFAEVTIGNPDIADAVGLRRVEGHPGTGTLSHELVHKSPR